MPVSINTAALKYRDQQGTYQSINSIKGDNGALNIVAPAYENLTYPIAAGQGCIYNDLYYVAKQDITSQESWTSEHWEQRMIADEVHGMVQDIQINGTSILNVQSTADIPTATANTLGVVKAGVGLMLGSEAGNLLLDGATYGEIKGIGGVSWRKPILNGNQHDVVFFGLARAAGADMASISSVTVGQYPETQKSAISDMFNAPETVSGTTPVITAKSGICYKCDEVSTLTITPPSSGDCEVIFTSGSTATVLTVTPPTGITAIKWANGFNPTVLDANTRYDLIITDGEWGVAASWEV